MESKLNTDGLVFNYLEENRIRLVRMSQKIWDRPELGREEKFASKLIAGMLQEEGFSIEWGVGQMETAFVATWGEGAPKIGVLGEYDALPGLSQKMSPEKEPIVEDAPGHGCGHNLLGVGALGAALAAKHAMEELSIPGTLRYYGCPAEETLVGKVLMVWDGVFDDLDAALSWHPGFLNSTWGAVSNAMNSFKVNFHGIASHAGGNPEAGRSALDGVMLMDVGVNYMREHVPQDTKIHCVITEGGNAPNVVPAYAQVWYYVRAPNRDQVEKIYAWMSDIAKGATLMTGTTCDIEFLTGCHDTLNNDVLGDLLLEKLNRVGAPQFSEEEKAFASELQATYSEDMIEKVLKRVKMTREEVGDPLCEAVFEPPDKDKVMGGSTDVGDVSYVTPTAQITTCCNALGTPGHSWQNVVFSGSTIGHKGMMVAAKALALALVELVASPELVILAREEFTRNTRGKTYVTPLLGKNQNSIYIPQSE